LETFSSFVLLSAIVTLGYVYLHRCEKRTFEFITFEQMTLELMTFELMAFEQMT